MGKPFALSNKYHADVTTNRSRPSKYSSQYIPFLTVIERCYLDSDGLIMSLFATAPCWCYYDPISVPRKLQQTFPFPYHMNWSWVCLQRLTSLAINAASAHISLVTAFEMTVFQYRHSWYIQTLGGLKPKHTLQVWVTLHNPVWLGAH